MAVNVSYKCGRKLAKINYISKYKQLTNRSDLKRTKESVEINDLSLIFINFYKTHFYFIFLFIYYNSIP